MDGMVIILSSTNDSLQYAKYGTPPINLINS